MKKVGLLVVDLQKGFYPTQDLIDAIDLERQHHAVTVFTKFNNSPKSIFRTHLNWHGFSEEDDATTLVLDPESSIVITKYGYGLTSEHIGMLKAFQCDGWEIAGVDSDSSILACGFSLWDGGIPCVVRRDLCESSMDLHIEAMKISCRNFLPS